MSRLIYLDHAAATPLSAAVRRAMEPFWDEQFYNPSATYLPARQARQALDEARSVIAGILGARPSEIIFTAGASEANNLVVHGVMRQFPKANMITSRIEHDSVLAPAGQHDAKLAPVNNQGIVDVARLLHLIDDSTVLVSIMYANHEVGSVQPIRELGLRLAELRIARLARGNQLPLYLHSDAAQAANYLDLHISRLGVDLLTINGSKLYGPKQSGALFVKAGTIIEPLITGGGQERGLRSGTENVAGCIGLAAALKEATVMRTAETERLQILQKQWFSTITKQLPRVIINGSTKKRLPNNVHLTFPGVDNERLLLELEQHGILAAAGSACSASSERPSHVLQAMGISDEAARSSLRFSLGRGTTAADTRHVLATCRKLIG